MANVQLTRQRQVQTTTTINEVQSMQLVQTMLHGALSTLTYLRALFPEKAFQNRYYEMRATPLPYKDFAAARMPSLKMEANAQSTLLPILVRKRSKRVDLFLDWLEKGVFPELESGEIRAVQLLIHPSRKNREAVLETYTFTVHYTNSENGQRTPSGLTANMSGAAGATAQSTNTALQQLLRSLSDQCENLPDLPAGRLMSMALVYENDKGQSKSVEGFVPCKDRDLSFAKATGWQLRTQSLDFTTDYHDTLLRITGLQNDDAQTEHTREAPSKLSFSPSISRYNDILLMPPPPAVPRPSGASKRKFASLHGSQELSQRLNAGNKGNNPQDTERRSSRVNSMKADLKNMMQPEQITQGDTQTQNAVQYSAFEDAVTVTPSSTRALSIGTGHSRTPISKDAFPLLSDTQSGIVARKQTLKKTANALAQKAGGRTQSGQLVLCPCGFQQDEGDMINCSICSTWQHVHCYGYTGAGDPRLPDKHVCYWCLLGNTEVESYKALQQLAVQRRAMFHMAQSGLRTITDLAETLSLDQNRDQAEELHTMIKKSKFTTAAAKSHKPGYRASGKALFVPVQDDATIRELLETYFNPMTHISHHYGLRDDTALFESDMQTNMRLIRSLATDLPPAATPHRSKVRSSIPFNDHQLSSAQPTPTRSLTRPSALDASAAQALSATSDTLPETPSLNTRRQSQRINKRALDVAEAEASDSKSFATPATNRRLFTSLRSARMIDANDWSSSPYGPPQ